MLDKKKLISFLNQEYDECEEIYNSIEDDEIFKQEHAAYCQHAQFMIDLINAGHFNSDNAKPFPGYLLRYKGEKSE